MDRATEFSQRLKQYAAALAQAGQRPNDECAIEQWLGFWDDDESVYGNLRNIEHWLSQATRKQPS